MWGNAQALRSQSAPTLQYLEKFGTEDAHTQHEEQHQLCKEEPCELPASSTMLGRSHSHPHLEVLLYRDKPYCDQPN